MVAWPERRVAWPQPRVAWPQPRDGFPGGALLEEVEARDAIGELFEAYERGGNPWRFRHAGVCLWPIYRFTIALRLLAFACGESFPDPAAESRPGIAGTALGLARTLPFELAGLLKASGGRTRVLGVSAAGRRQDLIDGRRLDMFFDPLVPAIEGGFTLSEACSSRQPGNPYPSIFSEYAYPFRILLAPLYRAEGAGVERELLDDFGSWLRNSEYGRSYGVPETLVRTGLTARFLAFRRYWRAVFRLTRPSLLLASVAYGEAAAVAEARSMGIPVWELQHGMISAGHFGYNYGRSAREHADLLPLPNRVLTFGRAFSDALLSCGYWTEEQVPVLGFPRLTRYRGARISPGARLPLAVMVSTQWTLENELRELLVELSGLLPEDARLMIKPHPRSLPESVARLRSLTGRRVEIVDKSSSLYEKLSEVDIHCSVYSTTLFESVGMGIPTVVLGLPGWRNVKILLDRGAALYAGDAPAVAATIGRVLEVPGFYDEWQARTERNGEYFFSPYDPERARLLFNRPEPQDVAGRLRSSRIRKPC